MAGVVRVSEAATLGLHALAFLAQNPDRRCSSREIAGVLGLSEAHLAKIMQRLERAGLVRGRRGPAGGFTLARPAAEVSRRSIYEVIEGPLQSERCLLGQALGKSQCPLGKLLKSLEQELVTQLDQMTLKAFAGHCDLRACSGVKESGGKIHATKRRNADS
jgi:Rrf2 family protein